MNATLLERLLLVAGVLHLGITTAGLTMTLVLDWRKNLAPLCALTRHIIWTHGAFVLLTIIAFGVVSIACAPSLASGQPLARAVCAFIASFWTLRLIIGFAFFDAKPHRRLQVDAARLEKGDLPLAQSHRLRPSSCNGGSAI